MAIVVDASVVVAARAADAASLAHADLGRLRVEYFPYEPFAERIWELRGFVELAGYSYEQQLEMLRRLRRGAADVATPRHRVELQMTALAESSGELERRADEALVAGRADLAQEALARKNAVDAELGEMRSRHLSLREEFDRLATASQRLQAKVDARRQQRMPPGRAAARA